MEVSVINSKRERQREYVRVRKGAGREEAEKFHQCCDDVGGKQRVGRCMGEKNAQRTGS